MLGSTKRAAGIQISIDGDDLVWNPRRSRRLRLLIFDGPQGWHLDQCCGPAFGSAVIIAPTDIIGSAAINVIGSPFGDIIGPLTPKNRTACRGDLLSGELDTGAAIFGDGCWGYDGVTDRGENNDRPTPISIPRNGSFAAISPRPIGCSPASAWTTDLHAVRLPGKDHRFLLNPFGYLFDEITAGRALIAVDAEGHALEPLGGRQDQQCGASKPYIRRVHMARDDAQCVMHSHTTAAAWAVAAQEQRPCCP